MIIYIYGLKCPESGALRYIGKSKDPSKRFSAHHRSAERFEYQHHTSRWLRKLGRAGLKPKMVILRTVARGERWQDIERALILCAIESGLNLTNATAGGEGLDYLDPADTAAYRKNLSGAMKRVRNEPARIEESRQRSLKNWADPETKARIIAAMRVAQNRPDLKARLAVSKRVVAARPEVHAKKSKATKAHWERQEYRDVITAARNDPEFTSGQSLRLKSRWQDDAHRTKMQDARWTDAKRIAQGAAIQEPARAEKIKRALSDPALIKRRNAAIKASWARRKAEKKQAA